MPESRIVGSSDTRSIRSLVPSKDSSNEVYPRHPSASSAEHVVQGISRRGPWDWEQHPQASQEDSVSWAVTRSTPLAHEANYQDPVDRDPKRPNQEISDITQPAAAPSIATASAPRYMLRTVCSRPRWIPTPTTSPPATSRLLASLSSKAEASPAPTTASATSPSSTSSSRSVSGPARARSATASKPVTSRSGPPSSASSATSTVTISNPLPVPTSIFPKPITPRPPWSS